MSGDISSDALAADATLNGGRWRRALASAVNIDPAWRWFILGFALLMTGFLVGPRIPDALQRENCLGNIALPGPFGIHLNCDAPEFLSLATEPSGLLKTKNYRQSRPGLILIAALLNVPLSSVVTAAADGAPPTDDPARIVDSLPRYLPAYAAYMILNAGILLLSFHFVRKIAEHSGLEADESAVPIVVAVGLMIVSNDVAKAFFWSPHTQMFNVLAPVIAVYGALRAWQGAIAHVRFAVGMGLVTGFGLTAYGVFAIVPACIAVAVAVAFILQARLPRWRDAVNLALLLALCALPTFLWYVFVRVTTGSFFSAEVNEEAFVWMLRLWKDGAGVLAAEWFYKFWWMLRYAAPQVLGLSALVAFTLWMVRSRMGSARAAWRIAAAPVVAGLAVSAAVLVFYTCLGWIFPRLAYPIVPPLIVAAGAFALALSRVLDPDGRRILARGVLAIAIANSIYVVAKNGPFS